MKMSNLILALGDENVQLQNLDHCATDLNFGRKQGTKITFVTEQPIDLNGTKKLGLVLWLDRDAVAKVMETQGA